MHALSCLNVATLGETVPSVATRPLFLLHFTIAYLKPFFKYFLEVSTVVAKIYDEILPLSKVECESQESDGIIIYWLGDNTKFKKMLAAPAKFST